MDKMRNENITRDSTEITKDNGLLEATIHIDWAVLVSAKLRPKKKKKKTTSTLLSKCIKNDNL